MQPTILSHTTVGGTASGEVHRFGFALEEANVARPYSGVISLQTARVLVAELMGNDGFIRMLKAIVAALPSDYDTLIGQPFDDSVDPQGPADLSNASA